MLIFNMLPGWDGGQGGLGIDGRYKVIQSSFSDLANNTSAGFLALLLLLVRPLAISNYDDFSKPKTPKHKQYSVSLAATFSLTLCVQGSPLRPPRPVILYAPLPPLTPPRNTHPRVQRAVPPRCHTLLVRQKRRAGFRCEPNLHNLYSVSNSSELWDGFGDASGVACKLMMGLTLLPIARRSIWLDSAAAGFAEGVAFHRATGWWCVIQIVVHWITYTLKDV